MSRPGPQFSRYIGVDYSGAETADSSLKGLRVYVARCDAPAEENPPTVVGEKVGETTSSPQQRPGQAAAQLPLLRSLRCASC
jgi:hypothetical protein